MARITFDQLIPIYKHTAFNTGGKSGRLRITDHAMLDTLTLINEDENAFRDSGIRIEGDLNNLVLGGGVDLEISAPRIGLGLLAPDIDGVLAVPEHRIKEPLRYYLISERFAYNDATVPDSVAQYRGVLRVVGALSQAAAFVDRYQAEATFLGAGPLRLPIMYKAADVRRISVHLVDQLEHFVFEKIHKDQKLAILASNAIELCRYQPESGRFKFLLAHLRELVAKTHDSYQLFASEFSYEKIKTKIEEANNDYTSKIHKTFYDVQNQVLGVPVATVIVATQFKAATTCGVEFWGNFAISIGATFFVVLLSIALYNQLQTLNTIEDDLGRQEVKFRNEYANIAQQFLPLYTKLGKRVCSHRWILRTLFLACWAGVILTWYVFGRLTMPQISACF